MTCIIAIVVRKLIFTLIEVMSLKHKYCFPSNVTFFILQLPRLLAFAYHPSSSEFLTSVL